MLTSVVSKREDIRIFLEWLLDHQNYELTPEFDPYRGYIYRELESLGLDPSEKTLKELAEQGILIRKKIGEQVICPRCGSSVRMSQPACPFCGSLVLEKGDAIKHIKCGHIDFVDKFVQQDGNLKCPKCGELLKLPEEEYKLIEDMFRCKSCGSFFQTEMVYICIKYRHRFLEREAKRKGLYSYRLNPEALDELSKLVAKPSMFSDDLKSKGFSVTVKPSVKGISGITHTFSIRAMEDGKEYLVDIYGGKGALSPEEVAPFITKIIDVSRSPEGGEKRFVLASTKKFSKETRNLVKSFGIEMVEAKDLEDLKKKLAGLLGSEIPFPIS